MVFVRAMKGYIPRLSELQRYDQRFVLGTMGVFGFGLLLILLLQTVSYFIQREQIEREADTAVLVDLSGAQRMRSQRIALLSLALLNVQSESLRDKARKALLSEIEQTEAAHRALIAGDPSRGVSGEKSAAVREILFGAPQLDAKTRSFTDVAGELARAETTKLTPQNAQLFQITEKSSELLQLLDALSDQYRNEGVAGIHGLEALARQVLTVMVGVTIIIVLFGLYPVARRLKVELHERTRAQEDLLEQNRELEQFAAIVAHDLKAPLNNIGGFSQFLKSKLRTQDDVEAVELLEYIEQGVKRMSQMITELLQYARLTGKERAFERVVLLDVVKEVLKDFELQVRENKVDVQIGRLPHVRGDPLQIAHLFHNLISNALKYRHPERAPVIIISERGRDTERFGRVTIIVEDNGSGFPVGAEQRMFEPFRRLSTNDKTEGSGFGLALCRKIARRHNGSITVEHVERGGTRFVIVLPAS